jgi:NADH dehydrogenase/NADH:ubiquinone oxidoreductase subunit G
MGDQSKVKLSIDGKEIVVDEGKTILEAAQQNGVQIPTLCHHPALSNMGGCRLCVVEVDGAPKLAASCVMPVREGMEVVTSNERIIETRKTILEFIFAERNHNCMFCPASGDCELQNLAYALQMDHLTVSSSFNQFPVDVTSRYMTIDHNRCILCGRCVRACQEIAGASVLNFQNRGPDSLIGMDLDETREISTCYQCGPCLQVCPTGAISNRLRTHYAVKGHPKDWQTAESVCPLCGLLCPTITTVRENDLIKIEGQIMGQEGRPDHGQLCYKGRFEIMKTSGKRLLEPMVKRGNGTWKEVSWEKALDEVFERLMDIRDKEGGQAIFGMASSAASNEELAFFRDLMKKGLSAGHMDTLDGGHFRTIAAALESQTGGLNEASWKMIPESDLILLMGANPYASQPLISSLIRRAVLEKGAEVVVIGRSELVPAYNSTSFPADNGSLPLLIRFFVASVINRDQIPGPLDQTGLDEQAVKALKSAAERFGRAQRPLIISGQALTGHSDPSLLADVIRLARSKGLDPEGRMRLVILKPFGNSAGAWKLGIASLTERSSKEQLKGGLILLSDASEAGGLLSDAAIPSGFVAAFSPYFTEALADMAEVLIPKPVFLEDVGTYTSLDGLEISYKRKVLQRPETLKDSWAVLSALSQRVGFRPRYATWQELSRMAEREITNQTLFKTL